jgi:hypothetical protein
VASGEGVAMARKRRTTVWVVMHYEIFHGERVDSVQFHVSSSLKVAEEYMKRMHVAPYSWWQVHPHIVDCDFDDGCEGDETYYYSYTGRPLKSAPVRRALGAFRRERTRDSQK